MTLYAYESASLAPQSTNKPDSKQDCRPNSVAMLAPFQLCLAIKWPEYTSINGQCLLCVNYIINTILSI